MQSQCKVKNMFELKIKVKGEDSNLTTKQVVYENVEFSVNDPILQKLVKAAADEYARDIEDIIVTAKLQWQ